MGHTEEVNEQYYTYDITEMQDKQTMVSMVTKEIMNAKNKKETNAVQIDPKVIRTIIRLFCQKPYKLRKNRGDRI